MWIEMKQLKNLDCTNKKIIVRVDLNVPVFEDKITDYSRIHAILPTLEKLTKNKNKVFLIAHFGRPKGEVNKKYSIQFLCPELKKLTNDALKKGIFGAPTYYVNRKIFFGQDRLSYAIDEIKK